ncbi:TetR/AcrR family transcriptional regulator [Leptospira interrogans]|uniref:Transcriptional regulator, TetR family n=8 Tax=Leptospira interrogans TaxID=173 RepID=M3HGG6_LEPIR|nr:TetR/AcrR family transcriptional regulator [Leptospira interrogans]EMF69960.1 transcriptional regulator, TetR family [Leptospira interrogans serovar Canicola str. LT1962]EMG11735.1 transcriptional regulator, TetR family [Leptospira interrogans serovar Grippotyphosa str. LT2186]EMM96597.1 transcriptional regulator, TetR family [Leptospira interrogans serovar Zanoni str. LT2156]EMN71510.1 transcriptional regulator, TetR family [Leptospira interrogans serovar Bataviae str. UI 08561]OBZ99828.1 
MQKIAHTKQEMITAARKLIQAKGVASTGLMEIVAAAETSRGSIYHHFPGGKDELICLAIEEAAILAELGILRAGKKGKNAAEVIQKIASLFRQVPENSKWQVGCPVAATAIEGHSQSKIVRDAVANAFSRWSKAIEFTLSEAGLKPEDAKSIGIGIVAALEGGLLLARGLSSSKPYDTIIDLIIAGVATKDKNPPKNKQS